MNLLAAKRFEFLFRPVSPASLGLLRIAYGVLMLWQFLYIRDYMVYITTHSKFFITYDYLHWIHPAAPDTMDRLIWVGALAAGMMIVGLFHRLSSFVVFIIWTYIFLICRGHYTNHYYLFSLVGFWMFMTDANRWASVDRLLYIRFPNLRSWILGFMPPSADPEKPWDTVPYWQVLVFQVQLFIVYFYGGLAKLSADWLQGYPMRIWLPLKPWLPAWMKTDAVAIFMSWSGMVFDLLIGFVLLSRWRKWGLPFVIFFHVTNDLTFRTIGGFPHFMGAATLIFFSPDWPARAWDWLRRPFRGIDVNKSRDPKIKPPKKPAPDLQANVSAVTVDRMRKVLLWFMLVFWLWQFLYPFRHFLYPGDPSLTGEGSVFAWRMMLTSRDYGAKLKVVVDGQTFYITGDSFWYHVNFRQFTRMCRTPKSFHRFAHYIRDEMRKTNPKAKPEIYAFLIVQYNGRPFHHVIDTTVNLAALPYQEFGHVDWVVTDPFPEPPGIRYEKEEPQNLAAPPMSP